MAPHMRLRSAAVSDVGPHRSENQDAAVTARWGAVVADGVGGGPAGDLASAVLLHRLAATRPGGLDAETLSSRVRTANWDLRAHVDRDPGLRGMATTLTGLFTSRDGGLLLAHTGDSRAYLLREGTLTQQTRDDSLVQALVDQGLVAEEDAASHPRRNVITASLSGAERDDVSVVDVDCREGDRWLLCSDGLTDYVADDEILSALAHSASVEDASRACVTLALEAGTHDNVTAVVCDVVSADHRLSDHTMFYGAAAARFMEDLESA